MTIGIFTDDFYPNSGGVARSTELQITELAKRGHRVILFAPSHFFIPPEGIEFEKLDTWYIPGTAGYLCSLKFGDKLAKKLCSKYKFDIVHSQNERGSLFLSARIAKKLGIPHIHTFHSNYDRTHLTLRSLALSAFNTLTFMRIAPRILRYIRSDLREARVRYPRHLNVQETRLAKLDWKTVATLASYVDTFTSPAQYMIDTINDSTNGKFKERGFVIPNGINSIFSRAVQTRKDEVVRFLVCGRLDAEKRVDVIIKAFAKLPKTDTELYILGKGTDERKLKRLARKLRPKNQILFLGHYSDHKKLAKEFANSDVLVLASYRFETQGMVLGEAASTGSAILYYDDRLTVGVNEDNALLTAASATGLFDGMMALLDDRKRLETMKVASRLIASKISVTAMCDKYLSAYRRAISSKTSR